MYIYCRLNKHSLSAKPHIVGLNELRFSADYELRLRLSAEPNIVGQNELNFGANLFHTLHIYRPPSFLRVLPSH